MLHDFTFRDPEEIFAELQRGIGGHGAMKGEIAMSGIAGHGATGGVSGHVITEIPKAMHGATGVHLNDIVFDADNPGRGAFHCHNLYHMAAGMMTEVRYVG